MGRRLIQKHAAPFLFGDEGCTSVRDAIARSLDAPAVTEIELDALESAFRERLARFFEDRGGGFFLVDDSLYGDETVRVSDDYWWALVRYEPALLTGPTFYRGSD